jgi:hypothetical protein
MKNVSTVRYTFGLIPTTVFGGYSAAPFYAVADRETGRLYDCAGEELEVTPAPLQDCSGEDYLAWAIRRPGSARRWLVTELTPGFGPVEQTGTGRPVSSEVLCRMPK